MRTSTNEKWRYIMKLNDIQITLLHFQNRVLRDLKLNISSVPIFVNEGVPYNSCYPAFKFLVRNGCVKGRKIEGLEVCDEVEIWRFKMI